MRYSFQSTEGLFPYWNEFLFFLYVLQLPQEGTEVNSPLDESHPLKY